MLAIGGTRPLVGNAIRGHCTLWGMLMWVVCFVGPGWGAPADLSLYLDFEEVEPWREERWSHSIHYLSVAERSPSGQRWVLSVSQDLASAFVPLGPVAMEVVVGVHGRAVKMAGSVSAGWSFAEESSPRDGISVLVWHRSYRQMLCMKLRRRPRLELVRAYS